MMESGAVAFCTLQKQFNAIYTLRFLRAWVMGGSSLIARGCCIALIILTCVARVR